mgnify:FL=1
MASENFKIVCIVQVYNELDTAHLPEFFENASKLVDDFVIYDDGSTDGSWEYCQEKTPHVIRGTKNCFSSEVNHKTQLIQYADKLKPDFILSLDADEILLLTREQLQKHCRTLKESVYEGIQVDFINLWRSKTWKRVDSLFDEYQPVKLWEHRSGQEPFPNDKGTLHQLLHPEYIKATIKDPTFKILHTGFSNIDRIVRKFITYQKYGQTGFALTRMIDESKVKFERISHENLPTAYQVEELMPTPLKMEEYIARSIENRPKVNKPKFSIVCLIYKDVRWLEFVYESVFKNTDLSESEFFFVANGANDDVKQYLVSHFIPHYVLDHTPEQREEYYMNNVYRGYNHGVKKSKGDFVVLINSDMAFSPGWLENLYKAYDGKNCISSRLVEHGKLTPGRYGIAKRFGDDFSDYRENDFIAYAGELQEDKVMEGGLYMPLLMRKDHFDLVSGYPEGNVVKGSDVFNPVISNPGDDLISGDTAFIEKLGSHGIYHQTSFDSIVYHFQEGEKRSEQYTSMKDADAEVVICNDIVTGQMGEEVLWDHLLTLPGTFGLDFEKAGGESGPHFKKYIDDNLPAVKVVLQNASFVDYMGDGKYTVAFLQDNLRGMSNPSYIQEKNLKMANAWVTNSIGTASSYPEYPFEVIPVGVNHKLFRPMDKNRLRQKWKIDSDAKVGIFVGALDSVKGWPSVMAVIDKLSDHKWIIVSKYDCKYSHENVSQFNKVDQETLCELLNCADFFILGSTVETQCLAAIEAALCGLPVVMNRVGIFKDIPEDKLVRLGIFGPDFEAGVERLKDFQFSPRETILEYAYTVDQTKTSWHRFLCDCKTTAINRKYFSAGEITTRLKKSSVFDNFFLKTEFLVRKKVFQRIFKRDHFYSIPEISVFLNKSLPPGIFKGLRSIWRLRNIGR